MVAVIAIVLCGLSTPKKLILQPAGITQRYTQAYTKYAIAAEKSTKTFKTEDAMTIYSFMQRIHKQTTDLSL